MFASLIFKLNNQIQMKTDSKKQDLVTELTMHFKDVVQLLIPNGDIDQFKHNLAFKRKDDDPSI